MGRLIDHHNSSKSAAMATFSSAALSISGLCLVYNVALTAFRASTFEIFNVKETVARSVSMVVINLAVYSLNRFEGSKAQVYSNVST